MALKKDMSNLRPADKPAGLEPDKAPVYAPLLAEAWEKANKHYLEFAIPGTRIRNSWAGKCARQMSYEITETPETEPTDSAGYWVMGLGSHVHGLWQDILREIFPQAQVEITVDMRPHGLDASGHVDLFIENEGKTTAVELKTRNGYGFKMNVGARGPAEGPQAAHIMQGAMNALGLDADEMKIIYLGMENMSQRECDKFGWKEPWRKFCAEWTFTREQYTEIAEAEIKRMNKILSYIDEGELAPRQIPNPTIPPKARITDPRKGMWTHEVDGNVVASGTTWECLYCPFRSQCIEDGPTDE